MNIAIVEDHKGIREGLEVYFKNRPEFTCDIVVDSVEAFLKSIGRCPELEVVLLDINLPGMTGIEGIHHIKHQYPNVSIIMLTIYKDEKHVFDALKAGGDGYLLKNTPLKKIKKGLLQVLKEGAPISPLVAKKVINFFNPQKNIKQNGFEELTSREIEVLQALSDGLAAKNVANKLFVSIDTIRYHTKNIYKKLHVNSKLGAVKKYLNFVSLE
ncbi:MULTISPECIES: response regulator transcription factor [Flavobacteriaceae]|uniref:Response regulator transcription factor n=2 Tax=Flavobacteriaceae TaxID=49546 RepID=A0A4Y8AVW8_9FLAO|nr:MULTISPECIES: response regulator transcription factor [Flavobacteriaceae]TEW76641.1 response regulator transcription factor [Gramella jeungdoensis]GGK51311.1 DNA-binding response regulator [Lutibacter litoralis]